ncbi:unnamed protein product, partial [Medioppia subpectinata]
MIFNRGNSRGYDEWANTYGAVGWSYRDVLPVFREWENNTNATIVNNNPGYHGTHGPIEITSPQNADKIISIIGESAVELGFNYTDINGPNQIGFMDTESFVTTQGFRSGTGNVFIDPNPHPNNLHIVCKALVSKILFNGLTAIGVEFIVNDISYTVYANREVIVSAGAINTPQILMLSGIGPRQHLENVDIPVLLDLPVGDNYESHPNLGLTVNIRPEYSYLINKPPELNVKQLGELYYNKSGPLARHNNAVIIYSTQHNWDKQWPNVNLFMKPVAGTIVTTSNLVRIKSKGTIRLQSTDPMTSPLINPKWLDDVDDFINLLDAAKMQFYIFERTQLAQYIQPLPSFASIGCPVCPLRRYMYECVEGLKCYIRYNTHTAFHSAGSCRMGAIERPDVVVDPQLRVKGAGSCRMGAIERPDVVVDPQLRVKGANNLRVCDASVFPVIPNANTASASITVGYKCAQFIKDYYHLK